MHLICNLTQRLLQEEGVILRLVHGDIPVGQGILRGIIGSGTPLECIFHHRGNCRPQRKAARCCVPRGVDNFLLLKMSLILNSAASPFKPILTS